MVVIRSVPALGRAIEGIEADRPGKRAWLETRLYSRTLADDVTLSDGTVYPKGTLVGEPEMEALRDDPGITRVDADPHSEPHAQPWPTRAATSLATNASASSSVNSLSRA